jgi:hypothetical protein
MAPATRQRSALADALVADGPDPSHAEALMLFGRFVGAWDFDWALYSEDGERTLTERGEWIFGWVLEGRAVQDAWIIPERVRRGGDVPAGEYGTTIRLYDPVRDLWLVTWTGPINRVRRTFEARRSGADIVQDGETEDGDPMRWTFSDIAADSFTWRSVVSHDGGETWRLREEMRVRRRPEAE